MPERSRWTLERAQAFAYQLGIPDGDEWGMFWNREAVPRNGPAEMFFTRESEQGETAHRFTILEGEARPMRGFVFELFGRVTDDPITFYWHLTAPVDVKVEVWWMEVPVSEALPAVRTFNPLTGESRRALEVRGEGWETNFDTLAKRALRALDMRLVAPGPTAGTVKGTKYKTPEQWRAAITEKVLTKQTKATATDDTLAHWLGIGKATMYRLMGRWGPSTLDELRNGQT